MTLTPGVAVFPVVLAAIDTDADGVISEAEQRAYAERVLARFVAHDRRPSPDAPIGLDGISRRSEEMKEGRGEIRIEFERRSAARRLQPETYSRKPSPKPDRGLPGELLWSRAIRISGSWRRIAITHSRIMNCEYVQAGIPSGPLAWWFGDRAWLGTVALLLLARFLFLWRYSCRVASAVTSGHRA